MKPVSERLPAHLEPLRHACIAIDLKIAGQSPSISGVCISDQEARAELVRRWQYLMQEYTRQAMAAGATEIYINDLKG